MNSNSCGDCVDVSIIIPCSESHSARLKRCLSSLSNGSFTYEVIVVFNGKNLPSIKENTIRLIHIPKQLRPSQARNIGAQNAKGMWLHFLDADCIVSDTFFPTVKRAVHKNLPVVTGKILPETLDSPYSLYEWEIEASDKYRYKKNGRTFSKIVSGANFLIKRDLFFDMGMFRDELPSGEDRDLGARLTKKNLDIIYDEHLIVYHPFSQSLKEAVERRLWHGKGGGMIYFYHPDVFEKPFTNALRFIFQGIRAAVKKERSLQYAVYTVAVGGVYYSIALFWYSILSLRRWLSLENRTH